MPMSHKVPAYRVRTPLVVLAAVSATIFCPLVLAQAAPAAAAPSGKASPVSPRKEQVQAIVQEAYNKFKGDTRGKNADYIPELAKVDSKLFGIAIVTTDNQVVTVGDIEDRVLDSVDRQGVLAWHWPWRSRDRTRSSRRSALSRPAGRSIRRSAVVDMPTHTGNPLVNAGAIATVSLISGKTPQEKWNKILNFYSRVAGEKLTLIDAVYKSEAATNTGNKALSYLLAKYERIYADPFESVDVYTKECSVGVTAMQLARMGATLANHGMNPATGEQVIKRENVPEILSVMMMAGLYDGSGGWAWHVGLPAKSGVGGGIVAVVPGKGAIAVFAPPLDEAGNSVKAQEVIEYVANRLDYNLFSPASVGLK